MLVNNFERMYKGVCQELQELHPEKIKFQKTDYEGGHHFRAFARKINEFIPLSGSKEGYATILEKLRDLELCYTPSRFDRAYTLEEFRSDFRRYELQVYRLYDGLQKLIEKRLEEEKDLDELEQW